MRIASSRPMKNGGHFHWIEGAKPQTPVKDETRYLSGEELIQHFREWAEKSTGFWLQREAHDLGVSEHALIALGAVRYSDDATAFPMCNSENRIIGARIRARNGKKWALKGSRAGLIMPNLPHGKRLMICEGPTDAAAALTLGFDAIGRPSCKGQEEMVVEYIRKTHPSEIIIVADRDEAKIRPDGSKWFPGKEGAETLVKMIKRPLRVIYPIAKDLRAMVQGGASASTVATLIDAAKWENLH